MHSDHSFKHDTQNLRVAAVLADLRVTTDGLSGSHRSALDVDALERAVGERQRAVSGLRTLIDENPDAFTESDLEQVREAHSRGKRALESLLEKRRDGWAVATELSHNEYVLKTFARFGPAPGRVLEG